MFVEDNMSFIKECHAVHIVCLSCGVLSTRWSCLVGKLWMFFPIALQHYDCPRIHFGLQESMEKDMYGRVLLSWLHFSDGVARD